MRFTDFRGIPNPAAAHAGPLTVSSTAVLLSSLVALHANTHLVVIKVETAAVRMTVNGTTPTSRQSRSLPPSATGLIPAYLSR